ncbi:MAG TPA: chloride channel protein, partial [bacterium]|nr:chloride channel protein [bacterium]
ISATFGTPIAGVLFALEVILQEFAAGAFSMVVISSVAASVVSKLILGERFFFDVPAYAQESHWELLMYAAMGVVAALYGRLFIKILYGTEDLFDRLKLPEWVKPAIGGLCLGAIGLALPDVLGTSHAATEAALWGRTSALMLLALSLAKMAATSFTLGSGGSGGVFSPSLFIGAAMGGSMGFLFNAIFPGITASPGAYALVGMGAVFAAATRAPITAIIIVFEMTNDYQIILPMMISVVIATLVSSYISEETIYTLKLLRRGIRIGAASTDALSMTTAAEAMSGNVQTISSRASMTELLELLDSSGHSGFPVVDEAGALAGLITPAQIQCFLQESEELEDIALVADVMISPSPLAFCDDTLAHCAERMGLSDVDRLPVVGRDDPGIVRGMITHTDILAVYRRGAPAVSGSALSSDAASNANGGGI